MLPAEAPDRRRSARPAARALIRAGLVVALAAVAFAAADCGSEDEAAPTGSDEIELTVTLDPDGPGGEAPATRRASCPQGPGCAEAAALAAEDFDPTPAGTACTELYGGPDLATVEGTLRGEPVEADLTRADGCEVARFDRFADLLAALFPGYQPGASLRP